MNDDEVEPNSVINQRWFRTLIWLTILVSSVQLGLEIDEVGYPVTKGVYQGVEITCNVIFFLARRIHKL